MRASTPSGLRTVRIPARCSDMAISPDRTQTDGPVSFLIVDFQAPDRLRAYARFDAKRLKDGQDSGALLGHGHLARSDPDRRPGVVSDRGLPGAGQVARLCALRRQAA